MHGWSQAGLIRVMHITSYPSHNKPTTPISHRPIHSIASLITLLQRLPCSRYSISHSLRVCPRGSLATQRPRGLEPASQPRCPVYLLYRTCCFFLAFLVNWRGFVEVMRPHPVPMWISLPSSPVEICEFEGAGLRSHDHNVHGEGPRMGNMSSGRLSAIDMAQLIDDLPSRMGFQ